MRSAKTGLLIHRTQSRMNFKMATLFHFDSESYLAYMFFLTYSRANISYQKFFKEIFALKEFIGLLPPILRSYGGKEPT